MAVRRMRRTRARRLVQLAKPRVKAIKTKKSWEDLLRRAGGRVVVVMLGGEKSLMCHRFEPVFAELSKRKEFAQLLFAKVDVEKLKGIVDTSNVKQLPTFMCFRGGRLIETCEATSPAAMPPVPAPRQCAEFKPAQKSDETRGRYKCGRCGQIKVNHICPFATAQPRNADASWVGACTQN